MFLFTTTSPPDGAAQGPAPGSGQAPAPARQAPASGPVVQAIRDGASASGVGFDYLLATARRESALDPGARAATSSATGLYQFIEQTWLGVVKTAGPRLGLQAQADAITRGPDGTYAVADAQARSAILDLRRDPKVSATLAGALTQQNAEALAAALGRAPTAGDLYAAHVLGARGAAALIGTARAFPERAAALDLPEAAAANRALFYDRSGRARTAAELYASLSAAAQGGGQGAGQGASPVTDVTGLRQDGPSAPRAAGAYAAAATAFGGTSDLRSLFQTDQRGAVSDAAARLWQGRAAPRPSAAAPAYFPRTEESEADEGARVEAGQTAAASPAAAPETTGALPAPAGAALIDPPLPPRRPAALTAPGPSAATPRPSASRSGP